MKASTANLFNAIVLVAAGIYGYFFVKSADGIQSPTALIPAAFGVVFLIFQGGVARHHKVISHIVVVLTLALLVMCTVMFIKKGPDGMIEWNSKKYIFLACIISNFIALVAFIGSFIAARKARKLNA